MIKKTEPTKAQDFLVLGAGAWGGALALHLARQGHHVALWGNDVNEMVALSQTRKSHYLPDMLFPENIAIRETLEAAFLPVDANTIVLLVVPSVAFESMLQRLTAHLHTPNILMWATKGLSPEGLWLDEIAKHYFPNSPRACLSGPSFAREVALGLPTAVTLAAEPVALQQALQAAFHAERFRVYTSNDILGTEIGGVLKNVLAIAVGMADGLGFGANAGAALITRGFAEMCRLGVHLGAHQETLMGLAGLGDMVLTCTDNQSRNRRFGLALGSGESVEAARASLGVVEGYNNVTQLIQLANRHAVELPICNMVYQVTHHGLAPLEAMHQLLTRAPRTEGWREV